MTKNPAHGKKKILVCKGCYCVYETRKSKNSAVCPKCGRKHHTGRLYIGLIRNNRKIIKEGVKK